jgi:hypothetical protein
VRERRLPWAHKERSCHAYCSRIQTGIVTFMENR